MSSSAMEREMKIAYMETVVGRIGLTCVGLMLLGMGALVSCQYLYRLNPPTPCALCLENLDSTWSCDVGNRWGSETIPLCERGRAAELQGCLQLCQADQGETP